MGREKRIAESRAKELLDRTDKPIEARRSPSGALSADAVEPVQTAHHQSTAKTIVEILGLYLIPVGAVLLIGKVFFKL